MSAVFIVLALILIGFVGWVTFRILSGRSRTAQAWAGDFQEHGHAGEE